MRPQPDDEKMSDSERKARALIRSRATRRAKQRVADEHREEYQRYYDEEVERMLADAGLKRLRLWGDKTT